MPAKFWAVRRALRRHPTLHLDERPGKGSHLVIRDQRGRSYTISLHRGEHSEIADWYIRGLCRTFDLDYNEFKKLL